MNNPIQQAIEALESCWHEGLTSNNWKQVETALASLRAAQEGGLPPLPAQAFPDPRYGMSTYPGYTADQMREYARTAIAAAGGGVPQDFAERIAEAHDASLDDDHRGCRAILNECLRLLASSPQPEAAPKCTRSHPHENMDGFCQLRTEIARLTNENARLKAAPAVAQVPHWSHSCNALCVSGLKLWADTCPHCGMQRSAAPEAPAQLNPAYRVAPVDPTLEMIDAGAQRLVSWGENSTWPDSWDALQVAAARTEADRCYRSMILVAPAPEAPAQAEATDWILAMGQALGLDSGYSVPIVPSVDEFKRLFAEIRRRAVAEGQQAAPSAGEVGREGVVISAYRIGNGINATRVERAQQIEGEDLWAVRLNGFCLSKSGEWSWEPMPSSRTDDWLAAHRFASANEAIDAALSHKEQP